MRDRDLIDAVIWTPWFAWYPVRVDGRRRWLRWVERRWVALVDGDTLVDYRDRTR